MKKTILPAFVVALFAIASCNNAKGPDVDSSIIPPKDSAPQDLSSTIPANSTPTVNPATVIPNSNNGNVVMPMPSANTGQPQIVLPQGQKPQNAGVTAPGMNPPHGQPGHRCDIAVGAPLNSPKTNVAPAPVTTTTTKAQPATIAAPTTTAPGMNPPHGQPGHRCDIAVGAPLNSKPTTITQTGKQAPATIQPSKDMGAKQDVAPTPAEPKKVLEEAKADVIKEAKEEKKN